MEDFTIVKKLGQGGFGKVYLARREQKSDHKTDNDNECNDNKCNDNKFNSTSRESVVLKVYREQVDWERIEKSLELAMTLQHPNLMRCYSFFHDRLVIGNTGKSTVHIVAILEPLIGATLYQAYVNCKQTFSHYLTQLIGALKYLHSKQIVHGDIKPDNILVVQGKIKLIDYDFLARETDVKKARMGTPLFSAPELYLGKGNTCKSDLWSLGVTIYFCLTGKYPYVAKNKADLMELVHSDYVPDYSVLPERYGQIVSGLLEKDPEKRLGLSQISQILT